MRRSVDDPIARKRAGPRARRRRRKGAARAAGASPIAQLLMRAPKPLIHPGARMIVVFSAKSACSVVVTWFFHQLGHARAAADYHHWPHRYRAEVYYRSQLYQKALQEDLSGYAVVKVMRDPFERAASSYRHALSTGYADRKLAAVLGRSDFREKGYSFAEYIDFLEQSNLEACDMHHRIQRHPVESVLPVRHLIDITREDLHARLQEVEAELGLPRTDFESGDWSRKIYQRGSPGRGASDAGAYEKRFNQRDARHGPWPSPGALLGPEARRRLASLYAIDIEGYSSPAAQPAGRTAAV
jgi:hypothetical protein